MSAITAIMLLFPGSTLDLLWRINPHARSGFSALGLWAVFLMTVICAACTTAAVGLAQRKCWGYFMALTILSINLFGDTINAMVSHDFRALIGLPIGGGLIIYLVGQRSLFARPK